VTVQKSLDRVSVFLRNRGLDLSPKKSHWIAFTCKKILPALLTLKIFGNTITRVFSTKFLGIILDSKMTGKSHLQYLICKGSALIDILASLSGTWWDSHPCLLLGLYRSLFKSSIEYGC